MPHFLLRASMATAVIAAAAPVAAQSSVTLYGRFDVAVEKAKITAVNGASRNLNLVSNDGSRFGVRGSEDLGGGLRANFNLESGFAIDTGTISQGGIFWGRTSWVGLSGSMGEVRLGRNYIPLDDLVWPLDPFYAGGNGALWPLLPYASRVNNSIKYTSPMLGKLQLQGLASFDEGVAGGKQYGMSAFYRDKPIDAGVAYTLVRNAVPAGDRKELYVGAAFKALGPRLVASYFSRDDAGAPKLSTINLGANVPLGATNELRVSLSRVKHGVEETKQLAIGYWHPLSKRTTLYTSYMKQDNTANRNPLLNPSFSSKAPGEDAASLQFGMRHNF